MYTWVRNEILLDGDWRSMVFILFTFSVYWHCKPMCVYHINMWVCICIMIMLSHIFSFPQSMQSMCDQAMLNAAADSEAVAIWKWWYWWHVTADRCGLQRLMSPRYICWFWHYVDCLLVTYFLYTNFCKFAKVFRPFILFYFTCESSLTLNSISRHQSLLSCV